MASALSSSGKKSSVDLSEGPVLRRIAAFAMPLLLGQILQNLYNSVDSIVAGNCLGVTALAAVTSCADIARLLTGFFTGLSVGSGVVFARYFGAKDEKRLHTSIHTALTFAVLLGVTMMTAGILLSPLLLRLVKCTEEVYPEALIYLRIYLVGILFTSIYNVGAGVLRAVGDSRTPFIYLVISSVCNIILDVALVVLLPLGVLGAALATVVSQFISVILVFQKMLRTEDVYKLTVRELKMDKALLKEIMRLGLPSAVQSSLVGLSNLFIQRYINSFGAAAMAGLGAGKKIDRFVATVAQCLGLAVSTFVSQNVGAKRMDRAFRGIRVATLVSVVYVIAVGGLVALFAMPLMRIFTSDEEAVVYGANMIWTMMPFYFFMAFNQIFSNAVRGFGKSMVVMLCSVLGMIGCRQLFLAIALHFNYSIFILYIGFPVGWFCAAASVMLYYFFAIRRKYPEEARIRRPVKG